MTRRRIASVLGSILTNPHSHSQPAPGFLLRSLGNTGRQYRIVATHSSSTHTSTCGLHISFSITASPRECPYPTSRAQNPCLFRRSSPRESLFGGAPGCKGWSQYIRGFKSKPVIEESILIGPPLRFPIPLRSHLSSWTIFIVASLVTIVYALSPSESQRFIPQKQKLSSLGDLSVISEDEEFEIYISMPQEHLPGRVGNLTAEQEGKLKEFWTATLQVFGVLEKEPNGNARTDTTGSKKPKKKKRFSILRRNHDDDSESITSMDSGSQTPTMSSDSDDKYGQTKEFNEALANQSPESLRTTFWSMVKHDHPDALLLRFLRARKWDVDKALVMMVSTMKWRAVDVHVDDDVMQNGELISLEAANEADPSKRSLGEGFLAQMRLGKSFLHGLDKEGRPMCFVRARLHKQGEQSEESLERYTVFTIETARMILAPPVDTACVIFDMTGFSMANMDYAPVKFMIKCFEANYPESLGVVLVHKAPWVFQGIWKIIKGWLDPVVASKVHFTNNNQEMEEFIPKSNIIKELGGAEDWTYKYIEPVPGENDTMKDTVTRDKLLVEREAIVNDYEKATLDWIQSSDADSSVLKTRRNEIAHSLRDGYWVLDPYLRARSFYDRSGLIGPGGRPQFYPNTGEKVVENGVAKPNEVPKPIDTSADDLD